MTAEHDAVVEAGARAIHRENLSDFYFDWETSRDDLLALSAAALAAMVPLWVTPLRELAEKDVDERDVKCASCGSAKGRPCYGNGDMPRGQHGRYAQAARERTANLRAALDALPGGEQNG